MQNGKIPLTPVNFGDSDSDSDEEIIQDKDDTLYSIITNPNTDLKFRVRMLEKYIEECEQEMGARSDLSKNDQLSILGMNLSDIIGQLSEIYQMSGSKNIENFFFEMCSHRKIPPGNKVEAVKTLLMFEETLGYQDPDSISDPDCREIAIEQNNAIVARNSERKSKAYKVLDNVCYNFTELPAPLKLEMIYILMECPDYQVQSCSYFISLITDKNINVNYRYKCILTLETKGDKEYFLERAFLAFLYDKNNEIMYRILAGQYLLQKIDLNLSISLKVQNILLDFARNQELEYNLRADSADTLLHLAIGSIKQEAQDIIYTLGRVMGNVRTVFDNAQNVHITTIEQSVSEIIEFLSTIQVTKTDSGDYIDFTHVEREITKILDQRKEEVKTRNLSDLSVGSVCRYCTRLFSGKGSESIFCCDECDHQYQFADKIRIALNRICLDRGLYSKFNYTLCAILIRLWSYIAQSDYVSELQTRLLEELYDMSGTCSSGFISRLVNVISGYGDHNIKISWEDQIISNFVGRLNAKARSITDPNSIYHKPEYYYDILELYLREHTSLFNQLFTKSSASYKTIIDKYLEENREEKISEAIAEFAVNVLSEITIVSSNHSKRSNFLKFMRDNISFLRDELYQEFKSYISDTDFDLFFRKAIMTYEGEK